ncbi:hypothetical protein HBH56_172210 [Parastagonospora nodorum]|nr:hypothetical protein HBH56_172210 [Parastagonospora nodorum]QRC94588.1 hypothetical protein JI435_430820 [Parastagonospora nodorum SN15]KAH3928462.1 hypothetical protein HBH54_140770 [Parastagonospora nodorum]KAH3984090.1 hypothetical protein HBH52_058100 [Parastagonospora nodorum]KAH3985879.1 hypothetical protein HBH51_017000 [Parastagonospora nodorum]
MEGIYSSACTVFACLGGTVPDYSSGKSVALVYQEFVAGWFLALAKDLEDGPRFLYDLWFLEFSGFGGLLNRISGLPSWAPNFAGVANSDGVSFHVRSYKAVKKIPSDELTMQRDHLKYSPLALLHSYDMALIIFCRKTPSSSQIFDVYLRLLIADLDFTNDESSPL